MVHYSVCSLLRASGSIGSMDGLVCGEAQVTEVARRESSVLPNETSVIPLVHEVGFGQRRSGRLSAPLDGISASASLALKSGEAPHGGPEEGQNHIPTEPPEGMEIRLHATTREALTAAGLGGAWWGESGVAEQRPEQEEEDPEVVAARKEARDLLRAVPMCVRAWRCQRLGRQHAWTETLATLDVTSKVLLLRNLEVGHRGYHMSVRIPLCTSWILAKDDIAKASRRRCARANFMTHMMIDRCYLVA